MESYLLNRIISLLRFASQLECVIWLSKFFLCGSFPYHVNITLVDLAGNPRRKNEKGDEKFSGY